MFGWYAKRGFRRLMKKDVTGFWQNLEWHGERYRHKIDGRHLSELGISEWEIFRDFHEREARGVHPFWGLSAIPSTVGQPSSWRIWHHFARKNPPTSRSPKTHHEASSKLPSDSSRSSFMFLKGIGFSRVPQRKGRNDDQPTSHSTFNPEKWGLNEVQQGKMDVNKTSFLNFPLYSRSWIKKRPPKHRCHQVRRKKQPCFFWSK